MNAVQKEINARLMAEREASTPKKSELSTTTMTFIVVGFFALVTLVLNHYGLIQ